MPLTGIIESCLMKDITGNWEIRGIFKMLNHMLDDGAQTSVKI